MSKLGKKDLATKSFELLIRKPSFERVLWLNYAVTYHCNSRCSMCSIWQRYKKNPTLAKEEIGLKEIEEFLNSSALKHLQGISFTGGELFLRKDVVEIIGLFIKKYPKAIFGIATNGLNTELTVSKIKEIESRFNPNHLSVSLSLDGVNKKHDEIRGIPGAFESVNTTIERLKSETNVNIGIDFTITPWNYEDLSSVYDYTKEKNIKFLTCFAHHSDAYYDNKETAFDWDKKVLEEIEGVLKEIIKDKMANESLLDRVVDPYAFFLSNCVNHLLSGKTPQKCHSGSHSLFLDPYGNVYPCIILNQKLGNIKESSFDRIWTSPEAENIRKHIQSGDCACWVACESVPSILRSFDFAKWNLKHKLYRIS
jgi:MoaA/NifB/PqqE/SkfB family radical SAM enzyme